MMSTIWVNQLAKVVREPHRPVRRPTCIGEGGGKDRGRRQVVREGGGAGRGEVQGMCWGGGEGGEVVREVWRGVANGGRDVGQGGGTEGR